MLALVTLVLWKEELQLVPWLKAGIAKRLNGEVAPEQETPDRAARDLRRQAVSLRRSEFEMNRVRHAMNQIECQEIGRYLYHFAQMEQDINERIAARQHAA